MTVSSTLVAVEAFTGADEHRMWELVPLLTLPEVDLTVSVKSWFIRNRCILRVLRAATLSPVTFIAYLAAIGLIITVFYVPAPTGQIVGIAAMVLGVPGAFVAAITLRFEMVVVMLQTLDLWFSAAISTLFSVALGLLFRDARAAIVLLMWIGFIATYCVDASVTGLRRLWIANVLSIACCLAMVIALSTGATDQLKPFDLVLVNGHALSALAAVRECLLTMIIVVLRDVLRKHTHAPDGQHKTTHSTLFRCASFRCRLRLRPVADHRHSHTIHAHEDPGQSRTKLRYSPALPVLDVRLTLVPMPWLWRHSVRLRQLLPWVGLVGVVTVNGLVLASVMSPQALDQRRGLPVAVVSLCTSTTFVGLTTAAAQRELFWAIVTSFDFLYITLKITAAHVTIASLSQWQPAAALALVVSWLSWVWVLLWDAIPPSTRKRLCLSRRLAPVVALTLVGVMVVVVVTVLLADPSKTIGDPVLIRLRLSHHVLEVRSFSWLMSSVATVAPWVLRIVWRLSLATATELVVLDGTVVYENQKPTETRGPDTPRKRHIKPAPVRAPHATPSLSNVVA